jgi:hypothetical protein
MIVSIHQPSFFPWWPFFLKMKRADVFVILRHCQFEKNGFQNRFQYNNEWMTMSTKKGMVSIIEKKYANPKEDWERIKRKFSQHEKTLLLFDDLISESLWETNYKIIKKIADIKNIKTKIVLDEPTDLKSTDRLVDICKKLNAKKYIAGSSGKNYLDQKLFDKFSIQVEYQELTLEEKIHTLDVLE